MGMGVGEALRKLCDEIGWSYAVFWKAIGAADPVHLVWEDGYCSHTSCIAGSEVSEARCTEVGGEAGDSLCSLVKKVMVSQVHVVGEGTVGRAAFTGNHQWIIRGAANDHGFASEIAAEMNHQFKVGIQTIAVIPVLPRGVLQLGSTSVVAENTTFVLHAKKLCSQLNSRSSTVVSGSIKSDLGQQDQPRSSHGRSSFRATDAYPKGYSRFPIGYECIRSDTTTLPSSTSPSAGMNTSLLKITQQNGRAGREHCLYSRVDSRFTQQQFYCDRRPGSHIQDRVISSGFTSSLTTPEKHPLLMTNMGLLESANSRGSAADLPRNVLFKSLVCQNPVVHENMNIIPFHGRHEVLDGFNCHGNFDFPPGGANFVRAKLHNRAASQVLDQICHATPGTSRHKQPLIPNKVSQSAQVATNMENPESALVQAPAARTSESDVQVSSSGLNPNISQENQLRSFNNICEGQNVNEANDSSAAVSIRNVKNVDGCKIPNVPDEGASSLLLEPTAGNDLFDMLGPEFHQLYGNADANEVPWNDAKTQGQDKDAPESSIYLDTSPVFGSLDDEFSYSGIFSLTDTDQLLDAVISNINPGGKQISDDSASCKTSLTDIPSTVGSKELKQCESSGLPPVLVKNESAISNFVKQSLVFDRAEEGCLSQNDGIHKSQIRLWIESGQNVKCESGSASNSKGLDTPNKPNRKRSRPGENPRPRPKDRQLIQDRIKELREIVPNGAKCSIDALLEKTIKHMLFLHSVTKHADKLKDSTESKILGCENGPLWKDYFEGGATWAFEVGSQTMTCPIIVEDLDRPRQMLVEMLCEDRGIFLEIADFIRGLGLTILRGVMEARKSKIWARFTVEANRDVTRMEIFLSLVRLLEPNCESSGAAQNANNGSLPLGMVHQPVIPATGMSDRLR